MDRGGTPFTTPSYYIGEGCTQDGEVEVVEWAGDEGSVIQSEGHGHVGLDAAGAMGDKGGVGGVGREAGVGRVGSEEVKQTEGGGGIGIRYYVNMVAEPGIVPREREDQEEPKGL